MSEIPPLGAIPRQLTVDEFWGLFGRLEQERLDFKRGVSTGIRDTIAAMAMTHGGLIIHGVDSRHTIGLRAWHPSVASTCRSARSWLANRN